MVNPHNAVVEVVFGQHPAGLRPRAHRLARGTTRGQGGEQTPGMFASEWWLPGIAKYDPPMRIFRSNAVAPGSERVALAHAVEQ